MAVATIVQMEAIVCNRQQEELSDSQGSCRPRLGAEGVNWGGTRGRLEEAETMRRRWTNKTEKKKKNYR